MPPGWPHICSRLLSMSGPRLGSPMSAITPRYVETVSAGPPRDAQRVVRCLNLALDRLVRPEVKLLGRAVSAFHVCGVVGLGLAIAVSQFLADRRDLSASVLALLTVVSVAAFLVVVVVTMLVTGQETLVYYHHEIAVLAASAGVLSALDRPILAYLDAVVLGVGCFLACGRIGCLLVGCCHGRPAGLGARYGRDHVRDGFFTPYAGARLLPVPLLESLWVLAILAVGIVIVAAPLPPGTALGWYVAMYGIGRFALEFLRGDAGRPYLWGLSHAQWIALVLALGLVGTERLGVLPSDLSSIYAGSLAAISASSVAAGIRRARGGRARDLLGARHVAEVAAILDRQAVVEAPTPAVETTSLGVRISVGVVHSGERFIHYGISASTGAMSVRDAGRLARVILLIRHLETRTGLLLSGQGGVFHFLVAAR